jgi:hypothetical protein
MEAPDACLGELCICPVLTSVLLPRRFSSGRNRSLETLARFLLQTRKIAADYSFVYSIPLIPTFSHIMTLKSPGKKQNSWSTSLSNFLLLPHLRSTHPQSPILKCPRLCSPFNVRNQVSHPLKTEVKSCVCGLKVACWPLVPKFAGSNPTEAVGFLGRKKSSARLPSEGK